MRIIFVVSSYNIYVRAGFCDQIPLREEILGNWDHCFKEELEPTGRMQVKPVSLKLKEGYITSHSGRSPMTPRTILGRCTRGRSKGAWTQGT